jgi:hypothetical protein
MEDELVDMFITSAPKRLPASSKEAWVRVETSKNRFIWVRPRSDALLFDLTVEFDEFLKVEEARNVVLGKPLDPQQVPSAEDE